MPQRSFPFAPSALRIDQGPQVVEAVSGHEARGRQLPQPVFDLAREAPGRLDQLGEEGGAPPLEGVHDVCCRMGEPRSVAVRSFWRHEPVGVFPEEKRDRRDAGRADAADLRSGLDGRERGVWGEPAPHYLARETQSIQKLGGVTGDAPGEDVRLPRRRGDLVALELTDDPERSVGAMQARSRRDVVPGEEESHQIGRGYRFDFASQPAERPAVDSREEPPVAPFDRLLVQARCEPPAQYLPRALEAPERPVGQIARQRQLRCKLCAGGRAGGFQPSPYQIVCGGFAIRRRRGLERADVRVGLAVRIQEPCRRQSFGGRPDDALADTDRRRAVRRGKSSELVGPCAGSW
jgi:hypothetical protein